MPAIRSRLHNQLHKGLVIARFSSSPSDQTLGSDDMGAELVIPDPSPDMKGMNLCHQFPIQPCKG